MGRRKGGISKESMMKFGTPIGAGPNWAMVRPGFAVVGEPSGLRRVGRSIFWRSPWAICLAPWPFFACLPNRPLPLPPVFLPVLPPPLLPVPLLPVPVLPPPEPLPLPEEPPPLEPLPVMPPTMPPAPPDPPDPLEPPEPSLEVGALYSEVPRGPLQPGSAMSTRPSPSSSARFEHAGRGALRVTSPCRLPPLMSTVPEVAVPAAIIARAAPRAIVTRSLLVIGWTSCLRTLWVCRSPPPRTRRHG